MAPLVFFLVLQKEEEGGWASCPLCVFFRNNGYSMKKKGVKGITPPCVFF
jgi:hypothetical protein